MLNPAIPLGNSLFLVTGDALDQAVRSAVADAVARVIETHAEEVRELRAVLVHAKPLLTAREVGQHLLGGIAEETVMDYTRRGANGRPPLPCHRPGKMPLFVPAEVEAWVRTNGAGSAASEDAAERGGERSGGEG